MAPSGWEFAVDLRDLVVIGQNDVPAMAYTYAVLNILVDQTRPSDNDMFGWSTGGMSQIYEPWSELRSQLQNILGQMSVNLDETASAVLRIEQLYAATDNEARLSGGKPVAGVPHG